MFAQDGYLVASVDNRGTGGRGAKFMKLTYLHLGRYESADQIAAARWFGQQPFVSADRIGIWGWSYGGYMTSRTVFLGGGLFKAALAVAPVTDWRFYDTIYTERYMRTPQENPTGYAEGAPLAYADSLKGHFLLVHGTGDDNVHFQNSIRLVERLEAANKQFGMAIWSGATALAGLARSYAALFAARAAVGIGEAAYGTISPALLADYYPRERRGRVFAIFFAAIPIGSALGYVVGGLADHYFGWRPAFFVAGVPGLLLAALALRLHDPARGGQDPDAAAPVWAGQSPGAATRAAYAALLRNRAYVLTVLGYAAYTFAIGALAFWTPSFLERARGIPKAQATVQFGAIVVVTGFLGTYGGGWLGDRLLRRSPQPYLWVSGVATLAAAPLTLVALAASAPPVYWAAIVAAELLLFASTRPVHSTVVDVGSPPPPAPGLG